MESFFAVMQVYGWAGVDLAVVCFMRVSTYNPSFLNIMQPPCPGSSVSTARSYASEKCQIVVVVVVFYWENATKMWFLISHMRLTKTAELFGGIV